MLTTSSFPVALSVPAEEHAPAPTPPASGSWRYHAERRSRSTLLMALAVSAAAHVGLLLGIRPLPPAPVRVARDTAITVDLVMPEVEELVEVDVLFEERPELRFSSLALPRQMDLPTVVTSSDFVQALDLSSLVNPADLKAAAIEVPDSGARNLASKVEIVFNLHELDRHPEIVFQPELAYPPEMRRTGISARLLVEFIVDENGRTRDPVVIDSSDSAFDAAARNGILRWRFRPGLKDGRKVSTRVRVPVEYRIVD